MDKALRLVAATQALAEYVQHIGRQRITGLFGNVDIDPAYDYKAQRRTR